jgi:hypothetical protein
MNIRPVSRYTAKKSQTNLYGAMPIQPTLVSMQAPAVMTELRGPRPERVNQLLGLTSTVASEVLAEEGLESCPSLIDASEPDEVKRTIVSSLGHVATVRHRTQVGIPST